MIRSLVLAALLIASTSTFAGLSSDAVNQAGFSKLSAAEQAEILRQVASKAERKGEETPSLVKDLSNKVAAVANDETKPAVQNVDEWLNIGERIGKMIGGAAKEVGVAVNEFVKTPVGLTAMGLIVWHYAGGVIIHMVGGIITLVVGLAFIRYYARRFTKVVYEYDPNKTDMFGRSRLVRKEAEPWDGETIAGFMVATAIVMLLSIAVMFTY